MLSSHQNNQIVENNLKTFIFPEKFEDKQVRIYIKNNIDEWEKIRKIKNDLQKNNLFFIYEQNHIRKFNNRFYNINYRKF